MSNVLGGFEHRILLAVLRLAGTEGTTYTVPIVTELEQHTGRDVAPAAVYIALRRLEKRGLLRSRLQGSGRGRRYVSLTEAGVVQLQESRRALASLWEGVESLLDVDH